MAKKYVAASQSAKDRGLEFSLSFNTYKRLMRAKRCAYTKLVFSAKDKHLHRTLDRINNKFGYVEGNVKAVCSAANSFKAILENPVIPLTPKLALRILKEGFN